MNTTVFISGDALELSGQMGGYNQVTTLGNLGHAISKQLQLTLAGTIIFLR